MSERSILGIPLGRETLLRELFMVLLIKLVLIIGIRMAFFSDPVVLDDPHGDISQQLGVCLPTSNCSTSSFITHSETTASQQEDHHDQ